MAGVWMTPYKNGQCELSVRRDGIDKIVITTQTPLTDAQVEELFRCIGAMQRSGKTLKDLLKKQEAVKVQYTAMGGLRYGACPQCDARIDNLVNPKACGFCGQELKWE